MFSEKLKNIKLERIGEIRVVNVSKRVKFERSYGIILLRRCVVEFGIVSARVIE